MRRISRSAKRFVKARRVNPNNFFTELKRRNVYNVPIPVLAWLVDSLASLVIGTNRDEWIRDKTLFCDQTTIMIFEVLTKS
jgi:hypothetical protein